MAACERHTAASYSEMVAALEGLEADPNTTPEMFTSAQQIFGMTYDPSSLVFDRRLREIAGVPDRIFWDWQHCVLASGGVAQYGLNHFIRQINGLMTGHP